MASISLKVGPYEILETIGVGSFGKVKLAVHSQTRQKVALKFVNRKRIASLDMVLRIRREVQYLKCLRHPHIIKLCVLFLPRCRVQWTYYGCQLQQIRGHYDTHRYHHGVILKSVFFIQLYALIYYKVMEYAGGELFAFIVEKGRVRFSDIVTMFHLGL